MPHQANHEHSEAPLVPPHLAAQDSLCTPPPAGSMSINLLSDAFLGLQTTPTRVNRCRVAAIKHKHNKFVAPLPVLEFQYLNGFQKQLPARGWQQSKLCT